MWLNQMLKHFSTVLDSIRADTLAKEGSEISGLMPGLSNSFFIFPYLFLAKEQLEYVFDSPGL